MPPDPSDDRRLDLLGAVETLVNATGVDAALHAAVEAACQVTGSQRGLAGLHDGEAVTSDAWYDVRAGWTKARLRWELDHGAPGRVCLSATPLVCNDLPSSVSSLPEATEVLKLDSFACVPVLAEDGSAMGFIEVGNRDADYSPADVRLLSALARMAAARLRSVASRGRRLAEERAAHADIAERLQQRLLPGEPPRLAGLDVAFLYRSASAGVLSGGDFVDYYSRSPDTLAFAIGDVAGKGVEAMATTFVTKYILRAAVHGGQLSWPTRPGEALQELRTGLLEQPDFGAETERFVTVLFGLISTRRGILQLASAGHPTPFIVRASAVERPLLLAEAAIGVELGAALAPYPTETIDLERGDIVVLFTDGITELRNEDGEFFEDEIADLLAGRHDTPAAEIVADLATAGAAFSARPPADDIALLCIRVTVGRAVD
jgi:sigma-B regulation protein RsbU (phosphoserine phosphatase)